MLAYQVECHIRQRLAPILYAEHDKASAETQRSSIVAPLEDSPATKRKRTRHRTDQGTALTSFRDLLRHLASLTLNTVTTPINPNDRLTLTATPTDLQTKAFELLGVKPISVQ
jgi:hypothetical protein